MEIDIRTDDFRIIFRYMSVSLPINWADMKKLVKPLFKTHSTMTIIEEIEQEIREEALKEGLKEGMEKGYAKKTRETVISMLENFPDQPDERLAKVAKVTVAYVQEIKEELSSSKQPGKRKKKH